jgi:hypothetical protein
MSKEYVLRAFGSTLVITIFPPTPAQPTVLTTLARDGIVTAFAREGIVTAHAPDGITKAKGR